MCGIVGILARVEGPRDFSDSLPRLMSLMVRRGPDDEGAWSDGRHCAFGFRRLSILDLSLSGHQPMLTPDGRYAIVFNGEVYNFRELRHELEAKGVQFRSNGDTEVVLQSLALWGKGALDRFNGMFALAFYDTRERKLLLARDPVGIKPLYYLLTPGTLVFGSQYDQILAHPASRDCSVSQDALALYLRLGYIPAPYGILKNTHMLEPGAWLEVTADGVVKWGQYYSFPKVFKADLHGEAAFEAVDATVAEAVKRQMVSDVPLGCFLSGGIDSPLVAAKMASAHQGPVHAYTVGLMGNPADESSDATCYARDLKLEHVLHHFRAEEALGMIDDAVSACGEPFGDYSVLPTLLVSRLARESIKVILSGDGGDELFWGYAGRFGSVLASASQFRKPYALRQGQRLLRRLSGKRNPGQHLVQRTIGDWYLQKHRMIFEQRLHSVFQDTPPLPMQFSLFDYAGCDLDETAHWLRWNELLGHLTMILLKVDRASMYHSIEARVPLLDLEVIKLAKRIDWKSCLDLKTRLGKRPLRESLARHIRHQSLVKRGFDLPMAQWLRGPLRERFEHVMLERRELLGLSIRKGSMEQLARDNMDGKADHGAAMWLLFSLALWEDRHLHRHHSQAAN